MNLDPFEQPGPAAPWSDLHRQRYYEELIQAGKQRLTTLRAKQQPGSQHSISVEIIMEETLIQCAERELRKLQNRTTIL
jgi:hypothetical protein